MQIADLKKNSHIEFKPSSLFKISYRLSTLRFSLNKYQEIYHLQARETDLPIFKYLFDV